MANTKKKQDQRIPHTKIEYSKNTHEEAAPTTKNKMQAPRPVKDPQKPKALPRSRKK